jgi:hypothetical protein
MYVATSRVLSDVSAFTDLKVWTHRFAVFTNSKYYRNYADEYFLYKVCLS